MANRRAFTLVEMSVVLAIIGLLVGGVIVGQNLLRAQSLRNVLQDAKTFSIAMQLFKEKYGSLPGDMPDAIRVWGNADGGPATAYNCAHPETDVSVGNLTCNGNGDGKIVSGVSGENYRAWQHLSAAGMIAGKYTGVHGPTGFSNAIPGVNSPGSSLQGSTFTLNSWGEQDGSNMFAYPGNYDNTMYVGKARPGSSAAAHAALFSGPEAYGMDKKIDDGLPAFGSVRTFMQTWMAGTVGNCVTSDTPADSIYVITDDSPQCLLVFMKTFQAKPE